ncbi:MAG: hypothetical protein LBJ59_11990 [Zoogloeaceae bacterium]|jgi:hypothetical protein|nr:hypothetical protein [Zoogloeaceae bacterium]
MKYPVTKTLRAPANDQGAYTCDPDLIARWKGHGKNFVEAKMLKLDGDRVAYGVDYFLRKTGQSGPIFFAGDLGDSARALAGIHTTVSDIINIAQHCGIKMAELGDLGLWADTLDSDSAWRKPQAGKAMNNGDDSASDAEDHANAMMTETRQAVIAADAATREVARRVGYELPGGAVDPDLIQRDIAANMRRSVESCLEIGRGLLVLKSAVGHGNFMARLDVLGFDDRLARRFIDAAQKFSNRASTPVLTAVGSQTKLLELLVLDDEQIGELAETGQTGELKLDDVACMGVRELRKALRELREKAGTKDRVLAEKNRAIDQLQERLAERDAPDPDMVADPDEMEIDRPGEDEIGSLNETADEMETIAVRLLSQVRALRAVMPDTPMRRARETSALMRAFAALRTTAMELDIAVTDDGGATIDPEGEDEEIKQIIQARSRELSRGRDAE